MQRGPSHDPAAALSTSLIELAGAMTELLCTHLVGAASFVAALQAKELVRLEGARRDRYANGARSSPRDALDEETAPRPHAGRGGGSPCAGTSPRASPIITGSTTRSCARRHAGRRDREAVLRKGLFLQVMAPPAERRGRAVPVRESRTPFGISAWTGLGALRILRPGARPVAAAAAPSSSPSGTRAASAPRVPRRWVRIKGSLDPAGKRGGPAGPSRGRTVRSASRQVGCPDGACVRFGADGRAGTRGGVFMVGSVRS